MKLSEEFILNQPIDSYKKLSYPLIFFAIFNAFYAFVDIFWAGILGNEALVVVGLCSPLLLIILTIGLSIGQGTNAVISRFLGSNDIKNASNTFIHGMLFSGIISILLPLIGIPFLEDIFYLMNINYQNINLLNQYMIPLLIFSFIFIFNHLLSECIQSEGDSKRPTYYIILGNIINLILCPIFIFVLKLEVVGLAYALIISSFIPLLLFLNIYLFKKDMQLRISLKDYELNFTIIKEILKITAPNFIDSSIFSVLGFYVNMILLMTVGPRGIAIYIFASRLREFVIAAPKGGSRALLTITGHLYGAKDIQNIKKLYKYSYKFEYILTIIPFIILVVILINSILFFSSELYSLLPQFNTTKIIILFGGMMIMSSFLPIVFICAHMLDGLGKSIYSLVCTFIKIGLDIVFIYLFSVIQSIQNWAVLLGFMVSEILISIIYIVVLKRVIENKKIEIEENNISDKKIEINS